MKRRLPPLKALPMFEVAARHLSFSAAADELHVTHGAVSRQVKALEGYLGVPLFRRLNRHIELTDAGIALLPAVQTAFDVLENSSAQIAAGPRQGPLIVSCLATFMIRWLFPKLYAFNALHPHIEVQLSSSYAPVNFARDSTDVAIRVGGPSALPGIEAHVLLEDRVGPVCSPALLQRHGLEQLSDLQHHTLLHTETRPDAWSDWLDRFGAGTVDVTHGRRFEHTYFLLEAAIRGLGVGIGSYPLVEEDLKTGRLVAPFGFVSSGRTYYLLHSKQSAGIHKIKAFRTWILGMPSKAAQETHILAGR
jgi:LysR family transcriptional regulator, glycine cleavage system transcriptional activator